MSDANAAPAPAAPGAPAAPVAGAPAAPAAAQAPVAPLNLGEQAPAPAPAAPTPAAPDAKGEVSWEPTGNVGLDMSLKFLGKHGFGPDHPAMQAAENGDFSLLRAELAVKGGAQGWEEMLALGESAFKGLKDSADAKAAEQRKLVEDAVGGADQWATIQKWATENAEPHEKESVNGALALGGLAAKAVAVYLAGLHGRASGVTVEPESPFSGAPANNTPSGAYALNPRAYVAEVQKLAAATGGRPDSHPDYAKLQARRNAWKG